MLPSSSKDEQWNELIRRKSMQDRSSIYIGGVFRGRGRGTSGEELEIAFNEEFVEIISWLLDHYLDIYTDMVRKLFEFDRSIRNYFNYILYLEMINSLGKL